MTRGSTQGAWVTKAPMLTARYTHAAVTLDGVIHVVGGADQSDCSCLTTHDVYDPVTDTWTTSAPMTIGRAHPAAAVLNNGAKDLLYVVGGATNCGFRTASMEAYDPATNMWTAMAPMPGGERSSMGAAVIDGRLYVVGGIGQSEVLTTRVEVYDPLTDTWTTKASLPVARYAMAIGAIDGILYVAGGGHYVPDFLNVDAYDPATNAWTPKAPLSVARAYVASAVFDGKLYAIGGQNAANLSSVEIYDPATNTWSAGPALPVARSLMPAALAGGRLYVMGGGYDNAGHIVAGTFSLGDAIAPATTATPSIAANGNGWNNSDVAITLSATDNLGGSGVASIVYALAGASTGGATVNANFTSFTITSEGTTTVTYHAIDADGNAEGDRVLVLKIDKTQPNVAPPNNQTLNETAGGTVATFSPSASDGLSGIAAVTTFPLASGQQFPVGTTTITVTAYDAAGNSAVTSFTVTVVQKVLQSVSVSPSSVSLTPGGSQTFQAIGHFSDGSTQTLSSSGGGGVFVGPSNPGWSVQMSPPITVNACATAQFPGPFVFSSQGFIDHGGVIDEVWSPGTPVVNVDGSITPSAVTLTLACTNGPATGSINAAWTGTRYEGTYTFNGGASAGAVSITGWSSQASMPAARFSHASASVNGDVYVFGGGNPSQPSPVFKYAPAGNAWTTLNAMPTSREGLGAAAVNGKVYVVGGHVSGGIASGVLEAYDASNDSWITNLAPMPTPRAHLAVVTDGVYVYALGGDTIGNNGGVVATVERYDPAANTWSTLPPMPTASTFVVAGFLNNTIVVAGNNNSMATDVYDIATNAWHSGAPMPAARSLAAAGVANGGMYVVGGTVNGSPIYGTWVYYPATNQTSDYWSLPASMPTARSQAAVAVVGDVLYVTGGFVTAPFTEFSANEAFSTPPAYTFSPFNGGGGNSLPTVQWQSTNPSVASVSGNGTAQANAVGQTSIVAVASNGISCTTSSSCATLSVTDSTPPTLFPPPNRTIEANNPAGATNVSFFVSSMDNADGKRNVSCTWAGGAATFFQPAFSPVTRAFPFGTTTISCTASDNSGNVGSTSFTFTVQDTNKPFLNVPSQPFRADATSATGATVFFGGAVSAFDSVDGSITPSCSPASGSLFPIGSTLVSCTATDAHGNTSLPKTFAVQVNDSLTVHLPANITAEALSAAGAAVPFSVTATYFLGGSEPVECFIITGFVGGDPQIGPPVSSGATFPLGTTTVGCRATSNTGDHEGGFFTITVTLLSPQQIIAKVAAQAAAINYDHGANLLQDALLNLNAGSVATACNQLSAYINQIQAQTGKKISAANAAALIQLVNAARSSMGC